MKKFGIALVGLTLLSAGALADETAPTQRLVITKGTTTMTVQIPAMSAIDKSVDFFAQRVTVGPNGTVFNGAATCEFVRDGQKFQLAADQITVETQDKKLARVLLTGHTVVKVQKDAEAPLQIEGDSAVLQSPAQP